MLCCALEKFHQWWWPFHDFNGRHLFSHHHLITVWLRSWQTTGQQKWIALWRHSTILLLLDITAVYEKGVFWSKFSKRQFLTLVLSFSRLSVSCLCHSQSWVTGNKYSLCYVCESLLLHIFLLSPSDALFGLQYTSITSLVALCADRVLLNGFFSQEGEEKWTKQLSSLG